MSSSDLRARMDGLEVLGKADAVYPEPLSRHNRAPFAQQVSKLDRHNRIEAGAKSTHNFVQKMRLCFLFFLSFSLIAWNGQSRCSESFAKKK